MINTVFLAVEYDGMPKVLIDMLEASNTSFTCIFALEMVVKLIGLGLKDYVSDGFNVFDGVIVIIGLIELFGNLMGGNVNSQGITVLRTFRLLRIFKIVKSWKTLKVLLQTVINVSFLIYSIVSATNSKRGNLNVPFAVRLHSDRHAVLLRPSNIRRRLHS